MTNPKSFLLYLFVSIFMGCANDDNSLSNPTNEDLLISGKWYQESNSGSTLSDCEKMTSFDFNSENELEVEIFDDSSGPCQSIGTLDGTYSLTNDVNLSVIVPALAFSGTIQSISENRLVINSSGEIIEFDRTAG